MAKIQVWVSKPGAKKVPTKYADRIASYTQTWIIKKLSKQVNFAAAARKGKEKTPGFQIDGAIGVRVAGGNVNVDVSMQVSKNNSMFAFVKASGSVGAGSDDNSNASGAEQVIAAILESKMTSIVAQIRVRAELTHLSLELFHHHAIDDADDLVVAKGRLVHHGELPDRVQIVGVGLKSLPENAASATDG